MNRHEPTVIARTVARVVAPFILVTAVALLLQGHNLPGGGFIAGVLTTTAVALLYIIFGLDYIQDVLGITGPSEVGPRLAETYRHGFAVGLAVAAGSGLVAVALGYPFLTQSYVVLHDVPIYHELEVASALAFDLGVYFTVVGGLLTILAVVGSE